MLTPQMVGVVGLEPTRPEGHQLLRLARLPIPPHADKLKTGNTLPKNVLLWFAEPSLLVEAMGFEPTTLCVQSRCSSNWSYTPINWRLQGRYKITNRQSYHALNVPWWTLWESNPSVFLFAKQVTTLAVPKPISNLENLIKRTLPVFIRRTHTTLRIIQPQWR